MYKLSELASYKVLFLSLLSTYLNPAIQKGSFKFHFLSKASPSLK